MRKAVKITCVLAIATVLFSGLQGFGQSENRNILKSFTEPKIRSVLAAPGQWHPFPQSAAAWKARYPDSLLQRIIKEGEAVLNKDYPVITATISMDYMRNGDSKARYEKNFFNRRELLWAVAMAESVEGKGRFTDKIIDGIWAICEESFWGSTSILHMQKAGKNLPDVEDPVVDLYASETASLLGWIDYFDGPSLDKVSKLIRQRMRYEVNRRVFTPMLTAKYFYLTNEKPNNWAPWIMSNYIHAQLIFETDEEKRAKAIAYGVHIIDKYLNGLGNDGGSDEGPGYWFRGPVCVFDALNLLDDASSGKINVYKDPYIKKLGSYIYRVHIGGENYINMGDAVPSKTPDALVLFRYGKAVQDPELANFGSWVYHNYYKSSEAPYLNGSRNSKARTLYNMEAIKACTDYKFTPPNVADSWIADIQIMSARAANGLFVAAYGGNNGKNHNHNDVGNVLVYDGNNPVLIDLGAGGYTSKTFSDERYTLWFNTSPYHNLPTINGQGESAGKQFAAKNVSYNRGTERSSLSMDIANTYAPELGVKKWVREISMDKKQGLITIKDDYALNAAPKVLTQSFMTVCATDLSSPGRVTFALPGNGKVRLTYDAKIWEVKKEKMDLSTTESKKFKETWADREIWRILFVNKSNSPAGTVQYTLVKE